jgi:hypothetical protein
VYSSLFGAGLRISPDHTWSGLQATGPGTFVPITTGFDGHGTWSATDPSPTNVQFNLHWASAGAYYFVTFLDTGQMQMDPGGEQGVFRRPGVTCACASGGSAASAIVGDAGAVICSAPSGTVIPYTSTAELEALIEGDWFRCSGMAYPSALGVGLRISPDNTWSALEATGAGTFVPLTTGFDGYGTWTDEKVGGHFQFNLLSFAVGVGFEATFLDSGQMQTDPRGAPTVYQRLPAGGP